MSRKLRSSWSPLACAILMMAQAASAQTNSEVNAGIQFNFSEPGARSLSMGGAFLGLADDATAAYTNPAGLMHLTLTEASLEARNWSFTHEFTDRGRLDGTLTGRGVDTVPGLQNGAAENQVTGLSFLSVVYPRSRWTVALYRHELAHFAADFQAQGAFLEDGRRLMPTRNRMRLGIVNLGFSAAWQPTAELSLGAGISRYELSIESSTLRYRLDLPPTNPSPGGFLGPPLYEDGRIEIRQAQNGEDSDIGVNLGLTWRMTDQWSLGAVYRQGPRFGFVAANEDVVSGQETRTDVDFATPDVLGLGFVFQPSEISTFTLDVVRVEYSDLTDAFVAAFAEEDSSGVGRFLVDDAYEVHLGAERFVKLPKVFLALRAGAWLDPDHRFRYEGANPRLRARFRKGEDEVHYAAGLGVVLDKFQVDAAYELSDRINTASLSTVVRF